MSNGSTSMMANEAYSRRVARDVFRLWGARLGAAWIFSLIIVAVFAPFIATSYPLLVVEGDTWHSPAATLLTIVDVVLICAFLSALLVWFLNIPRRLKLLLVSGTSLLAFVIALIFLKPPAITIYEEYRENSNVRNYEYVLMAPVPFSPKDYLRDLGDTGFESPLESTDRTHWLGTEENGADVLSRMVHASRIALGIGFVATGIAMFLGVIIGGLMGFFSGLVDMLGMRLVEIFEAVPTLFLLLTFVAFFDRSLYLMMVIIGITSWPGYARYIRAEFLRLREQDFVQAAIVCGLPLRSILFRHMLPNGIAPVLVAASFGVASAILAESTLSFLGLGLVDDPSWGQMLNQAVRSSTFYWWMAFFPGGAIFLTVFSYNLIGDALRDAIDPHLHSDMQR